MWTCPSSLQCDSVFVLHSVHTAALDRLSVESSRRPTEPPAPPAGWRVLPDGSPSLLQGPLWAPSPWQHIRAAGLNSTTVITAKVPDEQQRHTAACNLWIPTCGRWKCSMPWAEAIMNTVLSWSNIWSISVVMKKLINITESMQVFREMKPGGK